MITLLFVYAVSVAIGIYSATHQYSVGDYAFTITGFAGLATPNFLLALVLMYLLHKYLGIMPGGLFSAEYQVAPWSLGKIMDLLKHLPIPIIVIGTAGTAGLIRVMRGCLLDELQKQYVVTARAKGVSRKSSSIQIPDTSSNQSCRQHHWMDSSRYCFRRDHHGDCPESAYYRSSTFSGYDLRGDCFELSGSGYSSSRG